jgi:hypothetical protein
LKNSVSGRLAWTSAPGAVGTGGGGFGGAITPGRRGWPCMLWSRTGRPADRAPRERHGAFPSAGRCRYPAPRAGRAGPRSRCRALCEPWREGEGAAVGEFDHDALAHGVIASCCGARLTQARRLAPCECRVDLNVSQFVRGDRVSSELTFSFGIAVKLARISVQVRVKSS